MGACGARAWGERRTGSPEQIGELPCKCYATQMSWSAAGGQCAPPTTSSNARTPPSSRSPPARGSPVCKSRALPPASTGHKSRARSPLPTRLPSCPSCQPLPPRPRTPCVKPRQPAIMLRAPPVVPQQPLRSSPPPTPKETEPGAPTSPPSLPRPPQRGVKPNRHEPRAPRAGLPGPAAIARFPTPCA